MCSVATGQKIIYAHGHVCVFYCLNVNDVLSAYYLSNVWLRIGVPHARFRYIASDVRARLGLKAVA